MRLHLDPEVIRIASVAVSDQAAYRWRTDLQRQGLLALAAAMLGAAREPEAEITIAPFGPPSSWERKRDRAYDADPDGGLCREAWS